MQLNFALTELLCLPVKLCCKYATVTLFIEYQTSCSLWSSDEKLFWKFLHVCNLKSSGEQALFQLNWSISLEFIVCKISLPGVQNSAQDFHNYPVNLRVVLLNLLCIWIKTFMFTQDVSQTIFVSTDYVYVSVYKWFVLAHLVFDLQNDLSCIKTTCYY